MGVTQGVPGSSLPAAAFDGLSSSVTRVTATRPAILSSLDANSSLDDWLTELATLIATNDTDIATNAADIATNVSDIATNVSDIATNAAGIAGNAADIATNAADIANNVSELNDLSEDFVSLSADMASAEARLDALEVPAGISDGGASAGTMAYWAGSSSGWLEMDSTSLKYDTTNRGVSIGSVSSNDGVVSIRATTPYTNILELWDLSGDPVVEVPRAQPLFQVQNRDIRIQESGTASKGIVLKGRDDGVYYRIYVTGEAVSIENA